MGYLMPTPDFADPPSVCVKLMLRYGWAESPGPCEQEAPVARCSVFARQLARAQQTAVQQQPHHQAEALDGSGTPTEEQEEPAVISYTELWDARTTAVQVAVSLPDEAERLREIHLWWPYVSNSAAGKMSHVARVPKGKATRLGVLQQSSLLSQLLQHPGALDQKQRDKKEADSLRLLNEGRKLAAALLGPPGDEQQERVQHISSNTTHSSQQGPAVDWVCHNKPYPTSIPNTASDAAVATSAASCGRVNPGSAVCCCECGAARWDGPSGQLRHRLWAVMQTADLNATGTRQVAARVTAESGSIPALGLQLHPEAVQQGVIAFLQARRETAVAADAGMAGESSARSVQGPPAAGSLSKQPQLASGDSHVVAEGVYQSLCSWHQQQQASTQVQQQEQQQQHASAADRIHMAAAAAAALAPDLLTAVFRRHNNLEQEAALKPVKPNHEVHPIHDWMANVLENTVAAANRHQTPSSQVPASSVATATQCSGHSRSIPAAAAACHPHPVRRPLPTSTLQQLLDRKTAVLCQEVVHFAHQLAAQGGLPVIKRTLRLADDDSEDNDDVEAGSSLPSSSDSVLLSEEMPVREWLWSRQYQRGPGRARTCLTQDVVQHTTLPAAHSRKSHPDDVDVVVHIACEDWELVQYVRTRLQTILKTWQQAIAPEQDVHVSKSTAHTLLEEQIQSQLIAQHQYLPKAWGTAAPLRLRQALAACRSEWQQQEQQRMLSRLKSSRRKQPDRQQQQEVQSYEEPGTAAAAATIVQQEQALGQRTSLRDDSQPLQQPDQLKPGRKRSREQLLQGRDSKEGTASQHMQNKRLTRSAAAAVAPDATEPEPETNTGCPAEAVGDEPAGSTSSGSDDSSSSSTNASESSNTEDNTDGDDTSSSSGRKRTSQSSDHQDDTGRDSSSRAQAPQQHAGSEPVQASLEPTFTDAQDELQSGLTMHLDSLDDLLSKQSDHYHDIGRPTSAWTAVEAQKGIMRNKTPVGGPVHSVADACSAVAIDASGLPTGMQVLLQQASLMGVSHTVLQRTTTRLMSLMTITPNADSVTA